MRELVHGVWLGFPPYTEEEQAEFEAMLRRTKDITVVRDQPRDRPPRSRKRE